MVHCHTPWINFSQNQYYKSWCDCHSWAESCSVEFPFEGNGSHYCSHILCLMEQCWFYLPLVPLNLEGISVSFDWPYPVFDSCSLLKILLMSRIVAGPGMGGSLYPAPDHFDHNVWEMAPVTINKTLIVEYVRNTVHVMSQLSAF